MIDQIYAIYDEKAEYFLPPFMLNTDAQAKRAFSDGVNNPQTEISKHPEDYQLFHFGQFDNNNGQYSLNASPKPLGNGLQFVSQQELFPPEENDNGENSLSNDPQLSGHSTG